MADATKSFQFASKGKIVGSFEVNGQSFQVRNLKAVGKVALLEEVANGGSVRSILKFFKAALTAESLERFTALALDPIDGFDDTELTDLFLHVLELTSGNPTSGASGSSSTPRKTGPRSTATTRAKASTL